MSLIKKFKDYFGKKEDKVEVKNTQEQLFKIKDDILYYFQSLIDDSDSHRVVFGPRVESQDIPYMGIELEIDKYESELKRAIIKFKEDYPNLHIKTIVNKGLLKNLYKKSYRQLGVNIYISYEPIITWD